jgi:hypothetical protein
MAKAYGIKMDKSKTLGLKYSSSLKEKPTGSFNLIKPLTIKSNPTKTLTNPIMYLIALFNFVCQPQMYQSEYRIIDHILIISVNTLAHQSLALIILNSLYP